MIKIFKGKLTIDYFYLMFSVVNLVCLIRWIYRLFTCNEDLYVSIIFTLIFSVLLVIGLKLTFKNKKI